VIADSEMALGIRFLRFLCRFRNTGGCTNGSRRTQCHGPCRGGMSILRASNPDRSRLVAGMELGDLRPWEGIPRFRISIHTGIMRRRWNRRDFVIPAALSIRDPFAG
jgi:hypothetical protein